MSWFSNRPIATKLTIAFVSIIAICLCEAIVTQVGLWRLMRADRWTTHTYQVLGETRTMFQGVVRQETANALYRRTHDPAVRDLAIREGAEPTEALARIKALTVDNASQQLRLADLATLIDRWRIVIADTEAQPADAETTIEAIRATIDAVDAEEKRLLALRTDAGTAAFSFVFTTNIFGPLAAVGAALFFGFLLQRRIAEPIAGLTSAMRRLASGDVAIATPALDWREEIGDGSRALVVFRDSLAEGERLRAERLDVDSRGKSERASLLASMADRFEARGFAVVAAEVKTLANQTSNATEDIRRQIESLQANALGSVAAINDISTTVGEMARSAVDMAAAVEAQREGTMVMASSTQVTAKVTAEVSGELAALSEGALTTGRAATDLLGAARALAGHSAVLREEAGRFVASVRAG